MTSPGLLAAVGLLLAGCAAGDPGDPAATTAPAPTPAHHAPYSDQHPRPRHGGAFVVHQLSTTREPRAWAEEVRTCVRRSSDHPEVVRRRDWSAVGTDGRTRAATGRPPRAPAYPVRAVLAPGQCVTGWWSVPVPVAPGGPTAIRFAPGGGAPVVEWPTLR